jgi:aryl-alcohol dehydrogenase
MGRSTVAAVLRQRDKPFTLEPIELPDVGIGEVVVRIAGVGVCHTDLLLREGHLAGDWPIVLGHEGSGVVEEIGPGVQGVAVGDHVVLSFDSCGWCANCLDGHPAYCHTFALRNLFGRGADGAVNATTPDGTEVATRWFGQSSFAGHVVASARNVAVIPKDVPVELAGPLGCSMLTGAGAITNVLRVRPGDAVAVLGAGSVGMAAIMAASGIGASRIVAVDIQQARLEQAAALGATHVVDARDADRLTWAITETGGPVDHVFDTTGHPEAIKSALYAMAARGVCGIVGVQRRDLVLPPGLLSGGKMVTAIYEGDAVPQIEIPRLAELWRRGRFPIDRLITTYPMSDIDRAERDMADGHVLKAVLAP